MTDTVTGLQLRSTVTSEGKLILDLAEKSFPSPREGQVLLKVEASPINPSDLGLLLGPADVTEMKQTGTADSPRLEAPVPQGRLESLRPRLDKPLPVGNEAAGEVIAAGAGAEHLVGKKVTALGGAMYAEYRLVNASDCLELPEWASAADGASAYVNPLTALSFVETMRMEGHTGLVHTAAASNLGQMLLRICKSEGVPLVCIVRSAEQEALLRDQGAEHVVDTSKDDWFGALIDACEATGATLGFDAIGGGDLAGRIVQAMEIALNRKVTEYSRYGNATHKQVYIYGRLDMAPTTLGANLGMSWGVGGYLLTPFLMKVGQEKVAQMKKRVMDELGSTFKSHYTAEISLKEALDLDTLKAYARRATGEKYLINPSK